MSLHLIPKLKGTGSRRAVDKVAKLRQEVVILLGNLHAAGDEVALLQQDLRESRAKQAAAEELVVQQLADIDDVTSQRDALAEEVVWLRQKFGAQLAAEANAARVTVPAWVRDTSDPADQATGPIDVREVRALWDARDAGLLGPVTDPGHT
ncbi:hypothetical protein [Streptomyces resistomycificus]|uniref:Uncharacterized protein n=1 Tax=Streptomyces resistomycificus TaxID=67356 RepID=A0A0L8L5A1_9ACTN|nr:hypothetical protein [Streptomyces resistomycificus]KOG33332.1 hypothetical protein ADK37_23440 [Streptomyces resistomycificus]KUN99542.1 hypothetical protein AQJ84_11380 [Streptomyces resistomycificus]